jgi:hypothetical protein
MARFYGSPLTGAWLQQQLMPNDIQFLRDFSSHHGVTKRIYEPHEFGYFWSRYLHLDSFCHEPKNDKELCRIDFMALKNVLADMSRVFCRPAVYKCSIAPFVLKSFMKFTDIFVVHITRDRTSTVDSILRVREQRLGDLQKWWSIRPNEWDKQLDKPPQEQVAWQYDKVFEAIRCGCAGYERRVSEINLDDLVSSPEEVLENIMQAYFRHSGQSVLKVGVPIESLSREMP